MPRNSLDILAPARTSSIERILSVVEDIPRGQVLSYGDIAKLLGIGPREVARVMAMQGDEVAWWRVLRSDGTCAPPIEQKQLYLLHAEGVFFRGYRRVDMKKSRMNLA